MINLDFVMEGYTWLADVASWDLSVVLNDVGTLTLSLPTSSPAWLEVRQAIREGEEVPGLSVYLNGGARSQRLNAHILSGGYKNLPNGADAATLNAVLDSDVLSEIVAELAPVTEDTDSETDRMQLEWRQATPGKIVGDLCTRAAARGFSLISFDTFDDLTDSTRPVGTAWPTKIDYSTDASSSLLDVLRDLVSKRYIDWECFFYSGVYELRIYRYGQLRSYVNPSNGIPRNTDLVEFHYGREVSDSDFTWDNTDRTNSARVYGGNGQQGYAAAGGGGRILPIAEHLESASALDDYAVVNQYAEAVRADRAKTKTTLTYGFVVAPGTPIPTVDYDIGDYVTVPVHRNYLFDNSAFFMERYGVYQVVITMERHRVTAYTLSKSSDGMVSGTITVGDVIVETIDGTLTRLSEQLARIKRGVRTSKYGGLTT